MHIHSSTHALAHALTRTLTAFLFCRMVKGGGIYLNNQKVTEELQVLSEEDLIDGKMMLIAAGKKNKLLVRVEG
jgi:tyrosyl-tRNA synthetase